MSKQLNIFYEKQKEELYRGVKERYAKEKREFENKKRKGMFSIKLGRHLTAKEINNLLRKAT